MPHNDDDHITLLSANDFANLQLRHTLDHPPDHVLFPFLHGLEGDNHAQNTFFASSSFSASSGSGSAGAKYNNYYNSNGYAHNDNCRIVPKVPEYRGLVWVACEEDLERAGDYTTLRILRRKPALTPQQQQQLEEEMGAMGEEGGAAGAGGAGAGGVGGAMGMAAVVSDSSSSEGLSDESSSYEDEDDLELDEDEQEMLLMIEADQAAVQAANAMHAAANPDANATAHDAVGQFTDKPPLHDVNSQNQISIATTIKNEPGLELDVDDDEDDSVLASPVQIQIPMHMGMDPMQLDAVHVVQSGGDEGVLQDGEHGVNVNDEAGGITLVPVPEEEKKDGKHYEGAHMHPVAHRPAPSGVGAPAAVPPNSININTHTNANAGSGGPTNIHALGTVQDPTLVSPLSPSSAASSSSSSSSSSNTSLSLVSPAPSAVPSSPGSVVDGYGDVSAPLPATHTYNNDSGVPQQLESPAQDPTLDQEAAVLEQTRGETATPDNITIHTNTSTNANTNPNANGNANAPPPTRRKPTDPSAPPLFTSTFRPKELLRCARGAKLRLQLRIPSGSASASASGLGSNLNLNSNLNGVPGAGGGMGGQGGNGRMGGEAGELEEEEGWEFVPARVPDGISLRNFGIQVPIYATLSDIVVYSPYGATPAAMALARRFKAAIKAKRAERLQAAGLGMDLEDEEEEEEEEESSDESDDEDSLPPTTPPKDVIEGESEGEAKVEEPQQPQPAAVDEKSESGEESKEAHEAEQVEDSDDDDSFDEEEARAEAARAKAERRREREQRKIERAQLKEAQSHFLKYEVYVLDADEEEMRRALPHLMMRVCGAGVPGGLGLGGSVEAKKKQEKREKEKEREKAEKGMDMDVDVVGEMDMGGGGDAMDVDMNMDVKDSSEKEKEKKVEEEDDEEDINIIPNTVDFALREREEMRDLTKASEIITLKHTPLPTSPAATSSSSSSSTPNIWSPMTSPGLGGALSNSLAAAAFGNAPAPKVSPNSEVDNELGIGQSQPFDPRIGQVFLGNSGDVPLAPDVVNQFSNPMLAQLHNDSNEEEEEWDWESMTAHLRGVEGLLEEFGIDEKEDAAMLAKKGRPLLEDDPFNYVSTNDPASGFGYDICVECHDLAPFPSTAHLRAAEEHMAMLDTMWKERWDKMMAARRKRLGLPSQPMASPLLSSSQHHYPPRPPPHANAVIHLPFPSSPPNTQATMVALMPVIRFLEKWIQPLPVPIVQPPPVSMTSTSSSLSPPVEVPRPVTPPELKNLMMISSVDPKKNMAGVVAAVPPASTPAATSGGGSSSRRWSSVTALMPSFPIFPGSGGSNNNNNNNNNNKEAEKATSPPPNPPPAVPLPPHPSRLRSFTSPSSSYHNNPIPPTPIQARTRPLKILMYSSDGYTESSVPALCLLMAIKGLMLPEAYLELQVEKRRSFFVYQPDLGTLRRVEGRLREEREREKEKERERERERERIANGQYLSSLAAAGGSSINANGKRTAPAAPAPPRVGSFMGRPAAKSISFAQAPPMVHGHHGNGANSSVKPVTSLVGQAPQPLGHVPFEFGSAPAFGSAFPNSSGHASSSGVTMGQQVFGSSSNPQQPQQQQQQQVIKGRPRATTSPWLPSLFGGDHQSWFNDPRFDGSFPSRVLPFLYLGNLNHASNVYMLHALGITHVVSVGECALVPPPHHSMQAGHTNNGAGGAGGAACHRPGPGAHFVPGKGPGGQGSLWIEEREGRIKVLDIKGVCDDGIDTLEPQLEPICDWIDKARQEGGQVLVHCRVGVSRSATVTIAYVMKHLSLPLVDAYLIVRSRRLSVLIQPNMRLLYNLCGWEIKLAKERANGDERKLKKELARALTWPYLAKEVHALNEKYLH